MDFTKAGIILFTQNYEACVDFYGKVLGLRLLHQLNRADEELTTFALGDTYLMVERGGIATADAKSVRQNPTKLRFNVVDLQQASTALCRKGIAVKVIENSWGKTAEFTDPDGNCCALRSDAGFGE